MTSTAGGAVPAAVGRPRVIIDCDPGHDDALALIVAARHAEIVGITTVSGNAPLDATTRNALGIAELIGLGAPVHAGAAQPLREPPRHATHIHGPTGLGGPAPFEPGRVVASNDAASFIIDTVRAGPDGEIWLVPIGPMTNIALALQRAPDLADRVAGISFMGGSATTGNVTASAEFNVWADPEAAAQVLAAGVATVRMSGLDLTRQFCVDDDFVALLAEPAAQGHAVARFCVELLGFYLDRQQAATGRRAGPAHDVCAVLALSHDLIEFVPRPVTVELDGAHTRAMTVVDLRTRPATPSQPSRSSRADVDGWPEVDVGLHIDAAGARAVLLEAILAAG